MDPVVRARLAAGALLAAAAAVAFLLEDLAAAVVLVAAAGAVLLLASDHAAPAELPDRASAGPTTTLTKLVHGLHLAGRGIHLPPEDADTDDARLFVPAKDVAVEEIPAAAVDTTVHRGLVGAPGLILPPPGARLVAAWRDRHGSLPRGGGPEELLAHLKPAFDVLGLGTDVALGRGKGMLHVRYRPTLLARTCAETRQGDPPWALQGGCPACSFVADLAARATGRPVRFASVREVDGLVHLELEVMTRSRA